MSPKFDKRTKKGKEDFAEFTKKNMFKNVISESDYELITEISLKVFRDKMTKKLLQQGEPEKMQGIMALLQRLLPGGKTGYK